MSILFQSDAVLAVVLLFASQGDVHFLLVVHDVSVALAQADASVGWPVHRKEARSIKTDSGVLLSSLVFHRDGGEPVQEFWKAWRTATLKAGCPTLLFHDLRRSAARQLIRSGTSKDVAKMLGGSKTDSMFSRYNVTGEEDLRDAMKKVTKYNEAESKKVVAFAR